MPCSPSLTPEYVLKSVMPVAHPADKQGMCVSHITHVTSFVRWRRHHTELKCSLYMRGIFASESMFMKREERVIMRKMVAICLISVIGTTLGVSAVAAPPPQVSMDLEIPGSYEKIRKGSAIATLVKHYGEPIVRGQGSYCSKIVWSDCRARDRAEQWQYMHNGEVINVFHRNLKVLHIERAEE